jgi:hypothetical protein
MRHGQAWEVRKKKFPKINQLGLRKGQKEKVNLSSPPWLTQDREGRKRCTHQCTIHPRWCTAGCWLTLALVLCSRAEHIQVTLRAMVTCSCLISGSSPHLHPSDPSRFGLGAQKIQGHPYLGSLKILSWSSRISRIPPLLATSRVSQGRSLVLEAEEFQGTLSIISRVA